jgi:hypothetical protein
VLAFLLVELRTAGLPATEVTTQQLSFIGPEGSSPQPSPPAPVLHSPVVAPPPPPPPGGGDSSSCTWTDKLTSVEAVIFIAVVVVRSVNWCCR